MTIEMKVKEGEWDSERERRGGGGLEYKWGEEGGGQREGKGEMIGERRNGDGGRQTDRETDHVGLTSQ